MGDNENRWQESGQQGGDYGREQGNQGEGDLGQGGQGGQGSTMNDQVGNVGREDQGQTESGQWQDESGKGTESEQSERTGTSGPGY